VAVRLAAKAYAAGQRLLVVADAAELPALDRLLWTQEPASFLPHAMAGALDDREQPILLAPEPVAPPANGARLLMLVGQPLPPVADRFDRVLLLFEAGTDAHARARDDWRAAMGDSALRPSYWQQTERGGWMEKGGT